MSNEIHEATDTSNDDNRSTLQYVSAGAMYQQELFSSRVEQHLRQHIGFNIRGCVASCTAIDHDGCLYVFTLS